MFAHKAAQGLTFLPALPLCGLWRLKAPTPSAHCAFLPLRGWGPVLLSYGTRLRMGVPEAG